MCTEERKIAFQATLNEIHNYNMQLNLMNQDESITLMRHETLSNQAADLQN